MDPSQNRGRDWLSEKGDAKRRFWEQEPYEVVERESCPVEHKSVKAELITKNLRYLNIFIVLPELAWHVLSIFFVARFNTAQFSQDCDGWLSYYKAHHSVLETLVGTSLKPLTALEWPK